MISQEFSAEFLPTTNPELLLVPLLSTVSLFPFTQGSPPNTQAGIKLSLYSGFPEPQLSDPRNSLPETGLERVYGWGGGVEYLGDAQQELQVHQELVDIPVEHGQLSPAHLEHLFWIRGCDHGSLSGPQEPIAGYFHIEGQATNVGRQPQAKGLAEDSGAWAGRTKEASNRPLLMCPQDLLPRGSHSYVRYV